MPLTDNASDVFDPPTGNLSNEDEAFYTSVFIKVNLGAILLDGLDGGNDQFTLVRGVFDVVTHGGSASLFECFNNSTANQLSLST